MERGRSSRRQDSQKEGQSSIWLLLSDVDVPGTQGWDTSHIVPFATNLVAQVLSCPASDSPTHIRWILNDAVVPLTGVRGCKPNNQGLCELDNYVEAMKTRIEEVDYQEVCFGSQDINEPDWSQNIWEDAQRIIKT